jgi:hypothetical protein
LCFTPVMKTPEGRLLFRRRAGRPAMSEFCTRRARWSARAHRTSCLQRAPLLSPPPVPDGGHFSFRRRQPRPIHHHMRATPRTEAAIRTTT